ncbi:MAG TPA: TIM barrel protein [Planctomycetota bacterium]|nr:TIM barrel protein [Planctomycetota bacterium]
MLSNNLRIGVWIDDLKLGVKAGLKAVAPLRPEIVGLDAFSGELSPRSLTQTGRKDLAQFVRARGTTLTTLRADLGGRRLGDREHLDANLSKLREAMQLAADLNVRQIVVPAGFIPPADSKNDQTALASLEEGARALVNFSSVLGVRVCWLAGSEPAATLRDFLNKADSGGAVEVDLNPGTFVMRGEDPLAALNELSSRIAMARAVDHYRGGAEAPFGKGDVRWGEVIVGLSTLNRNQPIDLLAACTLDGDRMAMLSAAMKRLTTLRQNPLAG